MFCYKCGAQIDDEAIVCPKCGCATKNYNGSFENSVYDNQEYSRKSRLVALLLCIFLGGIGVHRFYIGKIGTGIIWLFTVGCFGIGVLYDLIMIACGRMYDADGYRIALWD